ncbi:MAG: hypothetical protein U0572_00475 [Phycisphaerales bacterium]
MTTVVIVCPTAVERRALLARQPRLASLRVDVSGPGPAGIRRWAAEIPAHATVLLAGVAGGLVEDAPVGSARSVREVWHPDGRTTHPDLVGHGPTWRAAGSDHIVSTAAEKRQLAVRSGAGVVDMESHAFAVEARRRAWRHGIVRGVSDAADEELPREVESLLGPDGRTRIVAAVALLVRRPRLLPTLRALARRTDDAMGAVGAIVASILESERAL